MSQISFYTKYGLSSPTYSRSWNNRQRTFFVYIEFCRAVWFPRWLFLFPRFNIKAVYIALKWVVGQVDNKMRGRGIIIRYKNLLNLCLD